MRSWMVIPLLGALCAGIAAALGVHAAADPLRIVAAGLAGAALAACLRALAGDAPAAFVATVFAPLLAVITMFELGIAVPRELIAVAAAAWTCVELARPSTSPLVALLPAAVACILDPAFVAMLPIAGARVMTAPWERPRWAAAVPIAAVIAAIIRLALYLSHTHATIPIATFSTHVADALGPLTAVAALAGIASLVRPRHAEIALAASIAVSLGLGVHAGVVTPPIVALAAITSGLAVGRLAALIRLVPGQAIAGVTCAAVLLLAPTWSVIAHLT